MQQLKEAGMTNEQISKLSKGKWTSSTIKFYTPGIKPTHPTPWDDAISLLLAVDSSSLKMADLIHQYELLKEHGLPPKKVSEALGMKEELENIGLGLDSLISFVELVKNYGDPEKVIEALSQYKSLIELDQHITVAASKLDSLEKQLASSQEQIESADSNLSQLKELIEAYEKIKQLGFGATDLTKLSALAQKYGTVKKLIDAVDAYDSYSDVQDKLNKANSDLITLKSNIQELRTDNDHLKTAVTICQTLINKYAFGLDAIATIFSIAKKYGEPLNVLKAIETYGNLEAIVKEKNKQQGIASEIKKRIAELDGSHKEGLENLESLNELSLKVGNDVGRVQGEMAANDHVNKLLMLINEPVTAEYSDHIHVAIPIALSLRHWVTKNEAKFKNCYHIKSGLEYLIKDLGGLP